MSRTVKRGNYKAYHSFVVSYTVLRTELARIADNQSGDFVRPS